MTTYQLSTIDLKTQKYDRQLRLWASTGQQALENANICLLNATTTGCEILKNLILPGVGSVTIVDNKKVDKKDVQYNFFLENENISMSKAEAVMNLLKELNEEVKASFVDMAPHLIIEQNPEFFNAFDLIIATNLLEDDVIRLADICQETQKKLISVHCKGYCGVFRIQANEHTMIETHPENVIDIRLSDPFPQLSDFTNTFADLSTLDQTDHAHVPYIVILLIFAEKWKASHDGKLPQNYSERNELKAQIRATMRTVDEENFEEAISNIWRLSPSSNHIPSNVQAIFNDPSCEHLNKESTYFWIIARAVRDFVKNEGNGQLPLPGKLPDMKSDTRNYVALQNVYRQKAKEDLDAVIERVNSLLEEYHIPSEHVPKEAIESFCKNAAHVKMIKYRSIKESNQQSSNEIENLILSDENFGYYIVFKAADKFYKQHNRYPGKRNNEDEELTLLKQQVITTLQELGIENTSSLVDTALIKPITNFLRFADIETPNLAALVGGLVAQEVIKLITHQYIPINNTCLFNGIASTSSIFEL
ncbi:NEDD8-activating enzyme E1 regulatory subunit [Cunninghamella echinulata]|nr:NEDD8-activating enzyme E1 regulatory subunit [Cunninghamella echinulata]